MNPNRTRRTPRAAVAVRTARIARVLADVAPGTAAVRTTPVPPDVLSPNGRTLVALDDSHGRPVTVGHSAHKAARDLLRQQFSLSDWTLPHHYDVRTGRLYPLGTVPEARR
ncbi:hypothetical protein [Streptomyces mirabilis]|uniref:hypothetical protein n=1 Tax=Streptomyces mirabilis TaxID=68239 RepID=UPI00365F540C